MITNEKIIQILLENIEMRDVIEMFENDKRNYPKDMMPDPIGAIEFEMDQRGVTRKDLIPLIGSASKVSEVLNKKRKLSLPMIRRLNEALGIDADILIQDYEL